MPEPAAARAARGINAAPSRPPRFLLAAALLPLVVASIAGAQVTDPPPGAASDAPAPGAASEETAASVGVSGDASADVGDEFGSDPYASQEEEADEAPADPDSDALERRRSLGEYTSLSGGTGLMRVLSAGSGQKNTFRFSLLTGFYSGSGFLCPQCPDNNGQGANRSDSVDRVSANVYLSATPLSFLEAYLGIYSQSTADSLGEPQLLQVVGDWNLGAKVFLPGKPDQMLTAGGGLELLFATGSGQVGAASVDSVNVDLRGLATLDLARRSDPQKRIPLRAHVNLGYLFDNSAKLVEDFEQRQGPINRIQRFSLDVNRVDSFQIGLGVEGLFKVLRPFLEWTIDVPTNRQSYICTRPPAESGDRCLRDLSTVSAMPSRLTAGVRAMPWLEGLTFNGVLDLATGGTSNFLVELAPEVPWSVWFGLGYAVDPSPKVEVRQAPPLAAMEPQVTVNGRVLEKGTQTPIANAAVRFEGRDLTGLLTTASGHFTSEALEPGIYTLKVSADGYKPSSCKTEVGRAFEPPPAESTEPGSEPPPTPAAAIAGVDESVTCELEPVPKVANINGTAADANTGLPVAQAKVKIVDILGRALDLRVDEGGAFRFENVPPGAATITLQAPGYLRSVSTLTVEPLQELERRFPLFAVPAKPGVHIAQNQIQIDRPIEFEPGTATLKPASLGVIQELAQVLSEQPTLGEVEVQSHTSEAGPAQDALSLERANAVRDALILHGVPSGSLVARGYGGSEPVRPGNNEEARRLNERVRFKVLSAGAASTPTAAPATPTAKPAGPGPSPKLTPLPPPAPTPTLKPPPAF